MTRVTAAPSAAACQLSAQPAPEVTWPPLIPGITLGRAQAGGYENIPATPTLIGAAKSLGKHQEAITMGQIPAAAYLDMPIQAGMYGRRSAVMVQL